MMNDQVNAALSQSRWSVTTYKPSDNESSLREQRDTLRLKKALRRAVRNDVAPAHLIRSISVRIRA
jgi:hypothetical protein